MLRVWSALAQPGEVLECVADGDQHVPDVPDLAGTHALTGAAAAAQPRERAGVDGSALVRHMCLLRDSCCVQGAERPLTPPPGAETCLTPMLRISQDHCNPESKYTGQPSSRAVTCGNAALRREWPYTFRLDRRLRRRPVEVAAAVRRIYVTPAAGRPGRSGVSSARERPWPP